jgi:hypothetical protein
MDSIYNSTQHLKEALKAYGMKNNCPYVVVNSSKTRFGAKCKNVDCPMQLTAYKHQDGFVHVKVCHLQHSPYCMETKTATTSAIKSACRSLVSIQLKPKEVVNYIEYTHGATTTYHTAWKALNEINNEKQLEDDKSFQLISNFLRQLEILNPGSHVSLEALADGQTFYRTFLCLKAATNAFEFCRPIIVLDACHIKSQYKGIIMSACSHDGEGHIVPLAIAIGDKEDQANWMYFVTHLKLAIPRIGDPGIVVMTDRHRGLKNAITSILPNSHQSICAFHLEKNVICHFKSKFDGKVHAASKATTKKEFEDALNYIAAINANAAAYLHLQNPTEWSAAMFPVPRFGCTTSNSAESLNAWMLPLREGSHLCVLAGWVSYVATKFYTRYMKYQNIQEYLPLTTQNILKENIFGGARQEIKQFHPSSFELKNRYTGLSQVVMLNEKTCTCGKFQEFQFPCLHAAIAITKADIPYEQFMDKTYLTVSLQQLYSSHITPVNTDGLTPDGIVLPPNITRVVGRRKKKRIRSNGER